MSEAKDVRGIGLQLSKLESADISKVLSEILLFLNDILLINGETSYFFGHPIL